MDDSNLTQDKEAVQECSNESGVPYTLLCGRRMPEGEEYRYVKNILTEWNIGTTKENRGTKFFALFILALIGIPLLAEGIRSLQAAIRENAGMLQALISLIMAGFGILLLFLFFSGLLDKRQKEYAKWVRSAIANNHFYVVDVEVTSYRLESTRIDAEFSITLELVTIRDLQGNSCTDDAYVWDWEEIKKTNTGMYVVVSEDGQDAFRQVVSHYNNGNTAAGEDGR